MIVKPVEFENEKLIIHPFRSEDLVQFQQICGDIFEILSDEKTLKFLPAKRLNNLQEAELFLQTSIVNAHSGRNYLHFISHKKLGKVIGMIDLISPELAKAHYSMDHYPHFVEFYLSSFATGCYIMTKILPQFIDKLQQQGIIQVGAVINKENIAARKVLEHANFRYKDRFDLIQDLYETG